MSAPTLAPAPFTSAYFSPVGTLSPCDFSTPPESPCASISVGDAIAAAVACSPGVDSASPGVDSASPAPASAPPMGPRTVTVLGPSSASAFPASPEQEEAAPAFPSPLGSGTKASADTPNGNAGTPATAGTAAAGMPGLSPAILFIAAGAAAGAAEREPPTAASPQAATAVNSALAREVEELGDQTIEEEGAEDTPPLLAATVAGTDAVLPQGRPRVASKVSVPSSGFDSRFENLGRTWEWPVVVVGPAGPCSPQHASSFRAEPEFSATENTRACPLAHPKSHNAFPRQVLAPAEEGGRGPHGCLRFSGEGGRSQRL